MRWAICVAEKLKDLIVSLPHSSVCWIWWWRRKHVSTIDVSHVLAFVSSSSTRKETNSLNRTALSSSHCKANIYPSVVLSACLHLPHCPTSDTIGSILSPQRVEASGLQGDSSLPPLDWWDFLMFPLTPHTAVYINYSAMCWPSIFAQWRTRFYMF